MGGLRAIFSPPRLRRDAILSVSHPERHPTVPEMRAARLAFGRGGPRMFMELPPGDEEAGPPFAVKPFLRPPTDG